MSNLPDVIPQSVPAAKRALATLERDMSAAKTYEAIRKIERSAEAIRILFREIEDVRRAAERVIVLTNHRIGTELVTAPKAKGGGSAPKATGVRRTPMRATLKDQVGSKERGRRLKALAAIDRSKVEKIVTELHGSGKDASVSAVLKFTHDSTKKQRRTEREQTLAKKITALPNKRYGVLYVDPPWQLDTYSRETGLDRAVDNHYPTMKLDDIKQMEMPAAADCVLFMWATIPMLHNAFEVMEEWGFKYKSHMCWAKEGKSGTGHWVREKHELLLIGTRGDIPAPAPGEQYASLTVAPRGLPSEKPFFFREIIEEMFPNLPRIELFARKRFAGWDAWGNEIEPEDKPDEAAE